MYISTQTNEAKNNHYKKHPRHGECQFCNLKPSELVGESVDFRVIRNKFPYEVFDLCEVTDHLMVIPKKHTDNLELLSKAEKIELIEILSKYEAEGYNVYFREPKNVIKTMDHHHTHLIKLGKRISTLEYTKEPYSLKYS